MARPARASAATDTGASRTLLRRGAVGEHAVDDRAVELVQVAELVERVGDRGVGQLVRHASGYAALAASDLATSRVRRLMPASRG